MQPEYQRRSELWVVAGLGATLCVASPSWAYVGPGAGIVVVSSFLALAVAFVVALVLIVLGAFRWLFGLLRQGKGRPGAKANRVVILGFDGCDPDITERMMAEEKLPNLSALAETGTYRRLRTTCPPISPVAWSTFATGTNPGKHNIYDFLRPGAGGYAPELSSTAIQRQRRRLRIGRYAIPIGQTRVELAQQSKPFWETLGENGVFSAVMRVPITYPPKKFRGVCLAGMCVPDVLGTQGTFAYYTTSADDAREYESGIAVVFDQQAGRLKAEVTGPENPIVEGAGPMTVPFTLTVDEDADTAELEIGGARVTLEVNAHSDWVPLAFKAGPWYNVRGACRFCLLSTGPEVRLYQTPVNVDLRCTPLSGQWLRWVSAVKPGVCPAARAAVNGARKPRW